MNKRRNRYAVSIQIRLVTGNWWLYCKIFKFSRMIQLIVLNSQFHWLIRNLQPIRDLSQFPYSWTSSSEMRHGFLICKSPRSFLFVNEATLTVSTKIICSKCGKIFQRTDDYWKHEKMCGKIKFSSIRNNQMQSYNFWDQTGVNVFAVWMKVLGDAGKIREEFVERMCQPRLCETCFCDKGKIGELSLPQVILGYLRKKTNQGSWGHLEDF